MSTLVGCGSWLGVSKLRAQICHVLLVVVVFAGGSGEGGKDVKMLQCLVFNYRFQWNEGIVKMVMSPPSTTLGLNSLRLAISHMFSSVLRVRC
jgi:hypothetical protein